MPPGAGEIEENVGLRQNSGPNTAKRLVVEA